jgi:DnaJ family protein C protein 1
MFETRR